jgi:hypothetical protein
MATWAGQPLSNDDAYDIQCALQRLLSARDAITRELGLTKPPTVVVTAEAKRVEETARHLGLPVETALLYDDNSDLCGDARVVHVDKMTSIPPDRRADLLAFMEREVPTRFLDSDIVTFLEEASPEDRCIRRDSTGALQWSVPLQSSADFRRWPTPDFVKEAVSCRGAANRPSVSQGHEPHLRGAPKRAVPGCTDTTSKLDECSACSEGERERERESETLLGSEWSDSSCPAAV